MSSLSNSAFKAIKPLLATKIYVSTPEALLNSLLEA